MVTTKRIRKDEVPELSQPRDGSDWPGADQSVDAFYAFEAVDLGHADILARYLLDLATILGGPGMAKRDAELSLTPAEFITTAQAAAALSSGDHQTLAAYYSDAAGVLARLAYALRSAPGAGIKLAFHNNRKRGRQQVSRHELGFETWMAKIRAPSHSLKVAIEAVAQRHGNKKGVSTRTQIRAKNEITRPSRPGKRKAPR